LLLQERVRGRSPVIGPPHRIGNTSSHMTRMRSMFLSASETDSDMHVDSGVNITHAVKGVGTVDFQLESGGSLKAVEVSHVLELRVNLLSVSAMADKGYAVMFEDGQVLIRSKGAALDATVRLGIRQGMMYKLLGRPMLGSSGFLDADSVSESG
jgi:hypothetical protein